MVRQEINFEWREKGTVVFDKDSSALLQDSFQHQRAAEWMKGNGDWRENIPFVIYVPKSDFSSKDVRFIFLAKRISRKNR